MLDQLIIHVNKLTLTEMSWIYLVIVKNKKSLEKAKSASNTITLWELVEPNFFRLVIKMQKVSQRFFLPHGKKLLSSLILKKFYFFSKTYWQSNIISKRSDSLCGIWVKTFFIESCLKMKYLLTICYYCVRIVCSQKLCDYLLYEINFNLWFNTIKPQ